MKRLFHFRCGKEGVAVAVDKPGAGGEWKNY